MAAAELRIHALAVATDPSHTCTPVKSGCRTIVVAFVLDSLLTLYVTYVTTFRRWHAALLMEHSHAAPTYDTIHSYRYNAVSCHVFLQIMVTSPKATTVTLCQGWQSSSKIHSCGIGGTYGASHALLRCSLTHAARAISIYRASTTTKGCFRQHPTNSKEYATNKQNGGKWCCVSNLRFVSQAFANRICVTNWIRDGTQSELPIAHAVVRTTETFLLQVPTATISNLFIAVRHLLVFTVTSSECKCKCCQGERLLLWRKAAWDTRTQEQSAVRTCLKYIRIS